MYKICPKCRYERQPTDNGPKGVCPQCGLIFGKWLKSRFRGARPAAGADEFGEETRGFACRLLSVFLHVEPEPNPVRFWGRLVAYLALVLWGWHFIMLDMVSNAIGASFMHNVNLVFHEAGHVLFRLFGRFMTILGGSLFQVMVPLVVAGAFLFQHRNPFGASVGLWWAGQSLMDIAPYINDARARDLILLGGGTGEDRPWMHDWYNILGELGMLHLDHRIAVMVDIAGEGLMMLAMFWGGYLLYSHFRLNIRSTGLPS